MTGPPRPGRRPVRGAGPDEVVEFRRMYGRPACFVRVAVADDATYEAFLVEKLSGLSCVLRIDSHPTMKMIKAGP
ncbi:Lrp/AsnC ligand binding domain-containing protein [Streptomyces sp. RB17]|uniref:Lrp/AsnC ligand binding domain-containing protein n=1 Tax=Streptomyces sp. RB17 TaxID=2585197 RepID=UPI001E3A2DB4|nr:Lrp/AsnC ligand binding domain-containing protein [Streptomyces sp. RB17]